MKQGSFDMGKLMALGVAGALVAGGVSWGAYEVNKDPTIILTPRERDDLPKERPIIDSLATLVCDASVAIENCNETTMLGSKSVGKHETAYLSNISPFVPQAFIAGEDRNFREHFGADGRAIVRAGWHNVVASIRHMEIEMDEGASTITSLDTRWRYGLPHATNLFEKRNEAEIAMGLEKALEEPCEKALGLPVNQLVETYAPADYKKVRICVKDQVMTDILNRADFGRNAIGIEMAAQQDFGITAAELTQPQAIFEIAKLKAPYDSDLVSNTPEGLANEIKIVHKRYDEIVRDEAEIGDIDDTKKQELFDAFDPMIAQIIPFVPLGGVNTAPAKVIGAEHVTVRAMEDAAGILGITVDELAAGGYKVGITIDPHAQRVAADLVRLTNNNTFGYQAAMTAIAKDGATITMVGGLDRSVSKVNLATGKQGGGSGRNAGSSDKDIVAMVALENGHTGAEDDLIHIDVALDEDGVMRGSYTIPGADDGKDYIINTGDGCKTLYKQTAPCSMTIPQILEVSSNVGAAKLLGEVGTAPQYGSVRVFEIMRELGSDIQGDPVASVVVGSGDVSTFTQADVRRDAYLNQGVNGEPYLVKTIMDSEGKIVYDHSKLVIPPGKQVVSPKVAIDTLQMLRAPVEGVHGTAHAMAVQFGFPPNTVAAKTGTAPKTTDVWTNAVACDNETGGLAVSVWIGDPAKPKTLPEGPNGITSKNAALIAGAYISGIGAAVDGCQLDTVPTP